MGPILLARMQGGSLACQKGQGGLCGEGTRALGEREGRGIFQAQERGMRGCGGPARPSTMWWWEGDSEATRAAQNTSPRTPGPQGRCGARTQTPHQHRVLAGTRGDFRERQLDNG